MSTIIDNRFSLYLMERGASDIWMAIEVLEDEAVPLCEVNLGAVIRRELEDSCPRGDGIMVVTREDRARILRWAQMLERYAQTIRVALTGHQVAEGE